MSSDTITEVSKVVKWTMLQDKMIKFENEEDPHELSDDVQKFLQNNKTVLNENDEVRMGTEVKVTFDSDNKVVERITVEKTQEVTKTEEVNDSETDLSVPSFEGTIAGVSVKNKGVIFKEKEGMWFTLSDDIDAQDIKDTMQGRTVEIRYTPVDNGNDIIEHIELIETEVEENKNVFNNVGNETGRSFEAQASVEQAIFFYAQILKGQKVETLLENEKKINQLIDDRAQENFNLIQKFKKS